MYIKESEKERPGSTMSKRTGASTGSITTMNASTIETDYSREKYFCRKDGAFENAVEQIKDEHLKQELDGQIQGAWLLTEIDHWDAEREKLVILTESSLLVLRYDFITNKPSEVRRVLLRSIDQINVGDVTYPEKSYMPPREHGAVRVHWGVNAELSFGQRWNPWCSDIPFATFAHHRLIYNEKEKETVTYNVDDFYESLVGAINTVLRQNPEGPTTVKVVEGPILIETYASMMSMVFNQSFLGYNRDRSGVSF